MSKKTPPQNNNQHVLPRTDGWAVKKAGAVKDTRVFSNQSQAVDFAKQVAKNKGSELFIHSRDGRIRERNSYGKDPHPPQG
jgi:pterin-4a-carbinolamine dehydratase